MYCDGVSRHPGPKPWSKTAVSYFSWFTSIGWFNWQNFNIGFNDTITLRKSEIVRKVATRTTTAEHEHFAGKCKNIGELLSRVVAAIVFRFDQHQPRKEVPRKNGNNISSIIGSRIRIAERSSAVR